MEDLTDQTVQVDYGKRVWNNGHVHFSVLTLSNSDDLKFRDE